MKALTKHYQEKKDELQSQLKKAKSTKHAVEIVQDEIKRLGNIRGNYLRELTPPQARIASVKLGELYSTFDLLLALQQKDSTLLHYAPNSTLSKSQGGLTIPIWIVVVAGGVAGFVSHDLLGLLLGAGIAAVLIYLFLRPKKRQSGKKAISPIPTAPSNLESVNEILNYLQQRFETIDQEVATAGVQKTPAKPKLEDHLDLLEFLQSLIGKASQGQTQLPNSIRDRLDDLPILLKHHGIKTEFYQSSEAEDAWSKFDFVPSLDPNIREYITLTPAFVKGDRVLLRGRVVEPALTTQQ